MKHGKNRSLSLSFLSFTGFGIAVFDGVADGIMVVVAVAVFVGWIGVIVKVGKPVAANVSVGYKVIVAVGVGVFVG